MIKNSNLLDRKNRTVKYNGRDYIVQSDKNGFEYIKATVDGKRTIIPLVKEVSDVTFDYIFNYGFKVRNFEIENILNLKKR